MKKSIVIILFLLILLLGGVVRFYKLGGVPPSLSWDEAAVGYNAWTILHYGKDEWGKTMPLAFKSFGEYKNPIDIYLTVPSVAIFGLNEFGVRASSALFGVLNVLLIYFLGMKVFKNQFAGVISALVLAISPYNLHFSRFNHELNFAVFFFLLGLFLFLKSLDKRPTLLIFSFFSFGVSLITYNAAKILVPPVVLLLIVLYFKDLLKLKNFFFLSILVVLFFAALFFVEPNLLGSNRFRETSSPEDRKIVSVFEKYKKHYTFNYLFVNGDSNPRLSSQVIGEFYKADLPFLLLGFTALAWLIVKEKRRELLTILAVALLAPIPSSITSEAPHAGRAMFMTGSWHLILAFGILTFLNIFKNRYVKIAASLTLAIIFGVSLSTYLKSYYGDYRDRYAIEWQYGMKQVVQFVKAHPEYDDVYMTAERQEPYIFYLFYLQTPLPSYLRTVQYNQTISRSANTVTGFSRYHFGLWDPIESKPIPHVLYVVTPSEYSGLRYKLLFETVYAVKYPNGTDAFFLVTAKSTFD